MEKRTFGKYELSFEPDKDPDIKIIRAYHEFPNGYEASVVQGDFTYGGKEGRYEIGILKDGRLDYTTPLTEDVIGHVAPEEVESWLDKIGAL